MITDQTIRNFLEISYAELEKLNLELKRERYQNEEYFRKKLRPILENNDKIKAVTVCFADLEGKLLMLDYNKNFLLESEDNLTFDGSSIKGFSSQNQSDLRLKIDWSSFRWLPSDIFGPGKVLMFADVLEQDGTPYKSDYRSLLKIFLNELNKKEKLTVNVSPEIEGILLKDTDAEHRFDEQKGLELVTKGGYFNSLPQDDLRLFIDKVAEVKRALGYENEKDHPEVAPAQFELNYKYTDALHAADQILLYKLICRQVAKSMGCTATFLPKPKMNINGNGMHTNISISKNGKNMFYDKKDIISDYAKDFLTSILYHAKDICLILNPSVNAYRRLDPKYEAPNEIKVSESDRSAMIRIPIGNEQSARIEVRSVAPDCNPYLELFVLVKAGMYGINNKNTKSVLNKREKLPGNIYDAIRYFKKSKFISSIMGEENKNKYVSLKEQSANRCPKELGSLVKLGEIIYHHEITNQYLWSKF